MIYLGADHGGIALKEKIKKWLSGWNIEYVDLGAHVVDPNDDYPEYAHIVAHKVALNPEIDKGILVCRSGGGMVIAANKVKLARAVDVFDERSARHAREHNDANIAAFAADWINEDLAKKTLHAFLATPFSHEARHLRRVAKLELL